MSLSAYCYENCRVKFHSLLRLVARKLATCLRETCAGIMTPDLFRRNPPMNITKSVIFLALALQTAAHAGVNLLANPSGQGGATTGWNIVANGGDGWAARGDSADADGTCFITSYNWCTRSQTIDLLAAGYTPEFLDSSPSILVREFFKGFSNVSDSYFLHVELRDENGIVLETWEAGNQTTPLTATGNWELQEHRFENYPAGVREIYWEDGGDDAEFWAGHYGTLLDGAELTFDDPAPTALFLTPGTYPLNAPSGGVCGILNTDDNPEASHIYDLVGELSSETIVPLQSNWAFLDDGSDLGTVWIQAAFDDSAWASGSGELGYGEGDELTPIAGQGTHFTNYFRHRFTLGAGKLADISALKLVLKRDDGAVVYLNGIEIVRDNLAAGPIVFNTAATSAPDDGQQFHSFSVDPTLLVEGENVFAVEIHQVNLTSSDASFDLELIADTSGNDFDNALFEIFGNQLRFAQSGSSVPVAPGNSWTASIRTTDNGGNSLIEQFTITAVADPTQPPTAIALAPASIGDGQPEGTPIGDLSATDADEGDLHLFELVAGTGDDDNALFEVSGTRLVTRSVLDASLQSDAAVRVRATDRAGFTTEMPLAITIVDFNNPPTDLTLSGVTLIVNSATGTLLGNLQTADLDVGETHVYSVTSVSGREELFGFGNEWRFLDDNSDPGNFWNGISFDDTAWKSGDGSFGYGDAQTTPIDSGVDTANKYITTYFRRSIQVANPDGYEGYEFLVRRDDGVAVYLNSIEVGRDNLPEGADPSTFANEAIGGDDETTPVVFSIEPGSLLSGNNFLAAEIHQAAPGSSDLTFDLALVGLVDVSAEQYFEIVNGNEIRTTEAFANADSLSGTSLSLTVRTTDPAGDFFERTFAIEVTSDDPEDVDDDKLPDEWELTYFGNLASQGGADDFDGDGSSNREEFLFDTLPNDPQSRLDFKIINAGESYTVQWFSSSQRSYRLQSSPTLESGSWSNIRNGLRIGTDSLMSEDFSDVSSSPKRYFRLIAETP